MSKSLRNKVNNLENHILQPFKAGSTQFCHWALPELEQRLLERARELALMEIPFDEIKKEDMIILQEAHKRLRQRIFDLFTGYLTGWLCLGDKIAERTVYERFLWFITELLKEVNQQLEVSEIEKTMKDDDPIDKVDEYFRKAPEVFTKESYDALQDELFREVFKRMKKEVKV